MAKVRNCKSTVFISGRGRSLDWSPGL